jgi:hypothetical protein
MYDGYASGVLGWKKPEKNQEELDDKMANFVAWIHHWAAQNKKVAFVDDLGSNIEVVIQGKRRHIHKSDVYAGNLDPHMVVKLLIGITE